MLCSPEKLTKMKLLSHIRAVDNFFWIPSVCSTILDAGEIRCEIAMRPIFFREDTRWYLRLFWKNNPHRAIFILCRDLLLDEFLDDRLHIVDKIWLIAELRKGKSFIEAFPDRIVGMYIQKSDDFLSFIKCMLREFFPEGDHLRVS